VWTETALRKIEEHDLTKADVEYAVLKTRQRAVPSRSSGNPAYFGRTPSGDLIFVVFEYIDAVQILIVTAFPIED
jgi:hypothetical protein